jgi:hypothetical protein
MILPTKGVASDRALLSVGADILRLLDRPKTVSLLWDSLRNRQSSLLENVSYDWFLLSLDLLYMLGAIDLEDGRILKRDGSPGS